MIKQKITYYFFITILSLLVSFQANAQVYPVQMNTQLIPPYSLRLSDYIAPGTNRLGLNMLLTDLNEPEYYIRLELTIEGDGITIKTSPSFNPGPIILEGGIPQYFTSSDLAEWFEPRNLDFSGYSKSDYLATGRLPEGVYRFSFRAYDYNKGVRVSNNTPITAWLLLNDPPIINLPLPDYKVEHIDPQNIVFQWIPRHTGSPNSAFSTEYEFTLVEIWPEGRNPNDAILTGIPVYQTTTTQTTLVYGLMEPFLEPGRQYAYRIQARDMDERDMFKNNGYSEVRMFTFGEECKLVNNVRAKAERFNEAKISWEPSFTQTEFNVRYRKANDPDAEWFEEDTYISNVTVNGLEELTEYEYQVMGYCGTYEGDYSDLKTFTTPEPKVSSFECGAADEESSISNHDPLPVLRKGDYIWSGNFMFKIIEATGSNGNFSGKAYAMIPYLSFVKLVAEFKNIKVNTDNQVYEGEIKSIYNPDSPFVFGDDDESGDDTSGGDDTTGGDDTEISDTTFTTDIDSVYIDGDDIIIITEEGTDTIHTTDDIIIIDEDGDTWLVEDGEVLTGGGGTGGGSGGSPTDEPIVSNETEIKIKVEFQLYDKQNFGYDALTYDVHKPMYEQTNIYDETQYVPWKSLSSSATDKVLVKISNYDTTITPEHVRFRTSTGIDLSSFKYEGKDDLYLLILNGKANEETEGIEAYLPYKDTSDTEKEKLLGKLNTISYDQQNINLVIVPVNGEAGFSASEFTQALNNIYKQSAVNWNVTLDNVFNIDRDDWDKDEDGKMNDGESTLLSNYSDEQNKLRRKYKNSPGIDIDKNAYYVFLLNGIESKSGLAGYMPLKNQYAFIYSSGMNVRTIAHELGHGAFRLWHTFSSESNYYMAEKSSDNLMDYNDGDRLHKYQWDKIHNPEGGFYMFQDEDEGASLGDDICFTMENLLNNFEDWFSNNSDLAMFEHVSGSFDSYLNQIKESSENIELEEYSGWSIRDAAYKEKANSYLAEKIYENILNDVPSSLHAKGIYLGEFKIEGEVYNTAIFSYKDEVNIKKIHTNELCELANSEKIKVAIKDGYTLITFFDDSKNPEMVLQVNGDDLKTAKTWLTYLGIFTEKTTQEEIEEEINKVIEFWANLFGGDDSINAETLEKIEEASDKAIDYSDGWMSGVNYTCNVAVRTHLYFYKNEEKVLFPKIGSGLSSVNDSGNNFIHGEIDENGMADDIYKDLVTDGEHSEYFIEIEKGSKTWSNYLIDLQNLSNNGEIIIGVISSDDRTSSHGHIVVLMPENMCDDMGDKDTDVGNVKVPCVLEAGSSTKEIIQLKETDGVNNYEWVKYIK